MKRYFCAFLFLSWTLSSWADDFITGSGGQNAPEQLDKPYVVLVSIDGFRWDYPDLGLTPALDEIARRGVRAERLLPVWPTLTFPNHYSIATGLHPAQHGLVANRFPSPANGGWYALSDRASVENADFYGGEPFWVTAEKQGMVSAAFFFVGTEAPINGIYPTHWRSYDKSISGEARVDQVLSWLAEPAAVRPHLLTLYFEDVDDNSHWYGPESEQAIAAIQRTDRYVHRLLRGIEQLPHGDRVNVVVVSDHGQRAYLPADPFVLDEHIDTGVMDIVEGGSYAFLHLHADEPERARAMRDVINANWEHGRAWLRHEAPADWAITNDERFPDIIVQPDSGYGVISTAARLGKLSTGAHGWAPEAEEMHGIFLAAGPDIIAQSQVGTVRSVDVHPMVLQLLGLQAPVAMDGKPPALGTIFRNKKQ